MAVTPRAVSTNTTGAGAGTTQLPVTILGEVGDLALLWWNEVSGGLLTGYGTPAGWTALVALQAINGNTQAVGLFYKLLESGDPNSSVNLGTLSASRRQNIVCATYAEAILDSVTALSVSGTGSASVTCPSIDPVASNCFLVDLAAVEHPAANDNLITGTPTGSPAYTERADFGTNVAAIQNASAYIQDRQESGGGPFGSHDFTASHSVQRGTVVVALAPTAPVSAVRPLIHIST